MKNLMIAMSTLFTVTTLANARIVEKTPVVNFGNESVKVTELCVNGDQIQTKTAVTYCAQYETKFVRIAGHGEREKVVTCVSNATEVLSRDLDYTAKKCIMWRGKRSENDCARYTTITKSIPTSYSYDVVKVAHAGHGEFSETVVATKDVVVPSCN